MNDSGNISHWRSKSRQLTKSLEREILLWYQDEYYFQGAPPMQIRMKNIVIFTRDLAVAKQFYVDRLGLPLVQETQMMLEFFPGDGTRFGVALAMHEAAQPLVGRHTGITLTVDDIITLCRDLAAAGVKFAEPLEASPWGKMAVVEDPDGNQIALVDR